MLGPTPTSPTLADLMYGSYNQNGSLNTTAYVPTYSIVVTENARLSENLLLNLPGISYAVDTSDFLGTTESISVTEGTPGPKQFSASVSDSVTTAENVSVSPPA